MAQAATLRFEPGEFAGLKPESGEFLDLETDEVRTLFALAILLREGLDLCTRLEDRAICPAEFFTERHESSVCIEKIPLRAPVQQRLLFMLAIDFQEVGRNLRELATRDKAAVDAGAAAAGGQDLAAKNQLSRLLRFQSEFPERRFDGCVVAYVEHCLDAGTIRPRSNQGGGGPAPGEEHHRIEHNGFACTRLAGEGGHAGIQIQAHVVNQHEISNVEVSKHLRAHPDFAFTSSKI